MSTRTGIRRFLSSSVALTLAVGLSGCSGLELGWWNWFDPSRPVRTPPEPSVSLIFEQIGPADQLDELVPNATFPKPSDLEFSEEDYVIGPTDILRISVLDLFQEGLDTILERQVSHSGYVELPLLDKHVKASDLTAEQLTDAIENRYRQAGILKEATVSVVVAGPRQNTFSILGAIAHPGTYPLIRRDFTLMEALALAGDVSQVNIEWVYVIRPKKREPTPAPAVPTRPGEEELPPLPTVPTKPPTGTAPSLEKRLKDLEDFIPQSSLGPLTLRDGGARADEQVTMSSMGGLGPAVAAADAPPDQPQGQVEYEWTYSQGRWVRLPKSRKPAPPAREGPPTVEAKAEAVQEDPFGWKQYDMSKLTRIIAINLPKLKAGNPRMNIIIRDNDIVHIPPLRVGEFYVMGEVSRPGVYSLTGRRVTVKQAVAAAGNLGVLSWPDNCILVRRVGRDQEQVIKLPLNEIFAGRENDIFLKPDDVIAVGSHWSAPFLAVWRNAFRITYGFGFIYDRNYSERDFEIPILYPRPGLRPFTSD